MGILIYRRNQLKEIINNKIQIKIELEFDNNISHHNDSHYEIEIGAYFIIIDLQIEKIIKVVDADYLSPQEDSDISKSIDIIIKEVYKEDVKIFFNKYHLEILTRYIKEIINF